MFKKNSIMLINIIVSLISFFLLVKTSNSNYIFDLDDNLLIRATFNQFPFFNNEIASLSASVLAAYIFYVVNSYIPNLKKQKEYKEQISPHLEEIIKSLATVFRKVNEQSGKYIKFPVSDYQEIKDLGKYIKFGDTYEGMLVHNPHNRNTVMYQTIEYHMFHDTKKCSNDISNLRTKNLILDSHLSMRLDEIERDITFTLNKYDLFMKSNNSDSNFIGLLSLYSKLFESAKELTKHYNEEINPSKDYSKFDIWYNPEALNYAGRGKK